jgi:hypothetical protein
VLKTYRHPFEGDVVSLGGQPGVQQPPGTLVREKWTKNSLGILIANGDDFITVLWSRHRRVTSVV